MAVTLIDLIHIGVPLFVREELRDKITDGTDPMSHTWSDSDIRQRFFHDWQTLVLDASLLDSEDTTRYQKAMDAIWRAHQDDVHLARRELTKCVLASILDTEWEDLRAFATWVSWLCGCLCERVFDGTGNAELCSASIETVCVGIRAAHSKDSCIPMHTELIAEDMLSNIKLGGVNESVVCKLRDRPVSRWWPTVNKAIAALAVGVAMHRAWMWKK